MPTHLWLAGTTYLLSGFLDAFDGWAARELNQGTMFGAVLDMITDRLAIIYIVYYGKAHPGIYTSVIDQECYFNLLLLPLLTGVPLRV